MIKNYKEARELVKLYRSITPEQIIETCLNKVVAYPHNEAHGFRAFYSGRMVMENLTGFSRPTLCKLCSVLINSRGGLDCDDCIYSLLPRKQCYACCSDVYSLINGKTLSESYDDISYSMITFKLDDILPDTDDTTYEDAGRLISALLLRASQIEFICDVHDKPELLQFMNAKRED